MRKLEGIIAVVFFSLILGCGSVDLKDLDVSFQSNYFPLQQMDRLYTVDSIQYDLVGGAQVIDSSSSHLRQRLDSVNGSWFLEWAFRPDSSSAWEIRSYSEIDSAENALLEIGGEVTLVKLEFPLNEMSSWDESRLVDPGYETLIKGERVRPFSVPWEVKLLALDVRDSVGDFNFDHVIKKVSVDEDFLIERRRVEEWYADDIGLVWSRWDILDTQCEHLSGDLSDCIEVPWTDKANKGYTVTLTLESFEKW
jgi:hypothetical protein